MPEAADRDREKMAAARAAALRVRPGTRVALGTGTTATLAIRAIAERFPHGEGIEAVASSRATEALARSLGWPLRSLEEISSFDLMVDGADEVTERLDVTKGHGGALFREKLLARLTREVVLVVDSSKMVDRLGARAAIPVEVVPFAQPVVRRALVDRGLRPDLRRGPDGRPWLTDNANELLDVRPPAPLADPARLDAELRALPGVVDTGLFVGLVHRVIVGHADGSVEERVAPGKPA
jgi:ribose 5-phosphate isomerase A